MNAIRRSSYASVIMLSVQSFKSSDQMMAELAKMSMTAMRSTTLETTSESDLTLAKEYANKAELDKAEASTLHAHAVELELESEEEEALAKGNRLSAEEYQAKAMAEEAEADAELAEAAAEEAIFQEEREKAISESAEAAREHAQTESDALATGICEWIPFLDLVCDVIGGVAAVGFETSAAQLTAESVLDFAAATAAKTKEDEALTEAEALQVKAAKDEELASGLNTKAEEEELEAAEERAEGAREEAKAEELLTQSKEENILAEEEAGKGEEEAMKSEEQAEKSLRHGLAALSHAIVAGLLSFVSMVFFTIRFVIAVIIPGGEALVGFVPMSLTLPTGQKVSGVSEFVANSWMLLPKQQISYFVMHCSVLGATMVGFCSKFQNLELLDVRSRGGIIILFALTAAAVQGLFLHSIPRVISRSRSEYTSEPISSRIMGAIGILLHSMMYLIPLFLMEVTEIWLLAGKKIFSIPSLQAMNNVYVGGALVLSALLYTFAFHSLMKNSDSGSNIDTAIVDSCISARGYEAVGNTDLENDVFEDENMESEMHVDETVSLLRDNHIQDDTTDRQINDVESTYGGISFGSTSTPEEDSLLNTSTSDSIISTRTDNSQHFSGNSLPTATPVSNEIHTDSMDPESTSSFNRSAIMASVVHGNNEEGKNGVEVEVQQQSQSQPESQPQPSTPIISRYITDLKLPFEVLVITCMFVKLRECTPVLLKLGPQVVEGHPRLLYECVGVLLLICAIMWCLTSSNSNKHRRGHVGVWTGRFSTINV